MKFKTTAREIKANYTVIGLGYCTLANLLTYKAPLAYTCGVYGWNSDIYEFTHDGRTFMVSTGYRPFGNTKMDGIYELCKKYDDRAREIIDEYSGYDNTLRAINSLIADFGGDIISRLDKSENGRK